MGPGHNEPRQGTDIDIPLPDGSSVSGLLMRPASDGRPDASGPTPPRERALLVLAHGAGAGMRHPFMEAVAHRLADRGVATLRYQFPYMEAGRKRPDRGPVAHAAVRAAVVVGLELADGAPVFAGGKSFGGRMTSSAAAESPMPVSGLIFLGFPLHPAGRPGTERADHLAAVDLPMLFVQGTRDRLADLDLLLPVLKDLGDRTRLHIVEGGDHSFHVLKRSGRTEKDVVDEIADAVARFVQ